MQIEAVSWNGGEKAINLTMKFSVATVALVVLSGADAYVPQSPTVGSGRPTGTTARKSALSASYLDSLEDACDGEKPVEDCAPAMASYLDAVSKGAEKPSTKAGAGIASYLNTVAPTAGPAATASAAPADPAAVTGYLDAVSTGAVAAPPVESLRSYLDAVSMGSILPREAFPTNMAHEFSRAKSKRNTIGYESRKPYSYIGYGERVQSSSPATLLAAVSEICDADDKSPECANAIAAYEDAREAWPTSMGKELSRAKMNGNAIGYESRKPYSFTGSQPKVSSPAALLAAANEVCDADDKSPECASAIKAYEDARASYPTSMGNDLSRARTNGNTVGYESRKPYSFNGYKNVQSSSPAALFASISEACDADDKSPECASAIAAYKDAREAWPTNMGKEFSRGRANGNTVGYESRRPYSFTGYKPKVSSPAALLAAANEACDADDKSLECASAIAAYEDAREAWPTSMGQEFSRARSSAGTIGYESRKPYTYAQGNGATALLATIDEVCDADVNGAECKSAIAAYENAREAWPTSMGKEFSRAQSTAGTVGYESRKPYTYGSYQPSAQGSSPALLLAAASEACDADSNSVECANAIAAYEDARASYPTSMDNDLSRARSTGGTIGYLSRKPYTYGTYQPKVQGSTPAALLAVANEVCDADSKSLECANAIAAYQDARESWPTSMGDEFSRGRTTTKSSVTTVGYESRKPHNYANAINDFCDGGRPVADCAPAISSYLDAVSTGAAEPASEVGAGIASYMGSISGASGSSVASAGAAVSGYLDSVAAGAVTAPPAPAVKSYLEDIQAGEVSTPTTSSSIAGYLDALGGGASVPTGSGPSPPAYLEAIDEACDGDKPVDDCAPAIASYLDAIATGAAQPSREAGAVIASKLDSIAPNGGSAATTEPAAVSQYLDAVSSGSMNPPATSVLKPYLEAIRSGAVLPREAFPTHMAHEFARARTNAGNVGYESRRPYTYGRYYYS